LLQLTYMDAERYGCDFDWEKDKDLPEKDPAKTILQPKNNLVCGVKILGKQLVDNRKPLRSRSSYWSTLRPGTASYRVFAKQMTNVPAACRQSPPRPTLPLNEAKTTPSPVAPQTASQATAAPAITQPASPTTAGVH
jgi:hypothetical protein